MDFELQPCPHHWLLGELADLPRDKGRCKKCGVVKFHPGAYVEVSYYATDTPDLPAGERDIIAVIAERGRRET